MFVNRFYIELLNPKWATVQSSKSALQATMYKNHVVALFWFLPASPLIMLVVTMATEQNLNHSTILHQIEALWIYTQYCQSTNETSLQTTGIYLHKHLDQKVKCKAFSSSSRWKM